MSRRTKIVGTIGPASWEEEVLHLLIKEGLDVVRLNFSHAEHTKSAEIISLVRKLAHETGQNVAILQDLQGPRVRIGKVESPLTLESGQEIILTNRSLVATQADEIAIDYPDLPLDVKPDDTILIADGLIELKVLSSTAAEIRCLIISGGKLSSHKGINVPGVTLRVPTITDKDKADLKFGVEQGVDYVALSFVRRPEDIVYLKQLIREYAGSAHKDTLPKVIAKIEKHEAITNFDAILAETDGVMVARGDLGVELPAEQIPVLQKMIIHKCNLAGKTVITATQMLESMIQHPRPTRAEATDVANAILDGTDATMLSGETAGGLYPVEAVRVMGRIAETIEQEVLFTQPHLEDLLSPAHSITDAISQAACNISRELGAVAIITPTTSGTTARMVSRNRPGVPIYAITQEESTYRQLAMVWGVEAILAELHNNNTDERIVQAVQQLLSYGLVKPSDTVVITGGAPVGVAGRTNLIKVQVIGED
ncbi:MAG: pyruvate kinase [Chloroflexota bacterium]|nr:pyruvate kinase [Chloroflexota bacterium]